MKKVLLALVSIALGGLLAYWALQAPPKAIHPSEQPESAIVRPGKIYPVTPEMELALKQAEGKPLFDGGLVRQDGKPAALREFLGKPALLYFIQKDCPCCVTAGPGVRRLAEAFRGKAEVIGVIDGGPDAVAKWTKANEPAYPVLGDPSLACIRHYGVQRGTSMLLLDAKGTVVAATPGYGREIFQSLAGRIAGLAGTPAPNLRWDDMPARATSGCLFPLD
jgi:peroxiredoxin